MKIELRNFGPIYKFKFDLDKDLHVIYGENNIGKSYAIGVVYLILKNLKRVIGSFGPYGPFRTSNIDTIVEYIKQQRGSGKKKKDELDISVQFNDFIKDTFEQSFVRGLKTSITNSYSDLINVKNKFNNAEDCEITISFTKLNITLVLKDNDLVIKDFLYDETIIVKYINKDEIPNRKDRNTYVFVKRNYFRVDAITEDLYSKLSRSFNLIIQDMLKHVRSLHFLPASRSGLYQGLTALPPILAKLSQVRYALNSSLEIPALPEPVSDYFLSLSNVRGNKERNKYFRIAQTIENEILGAEIVIDTENSKIEYYNKLINLRLDLSETSSMISEVAPIVAYLKYIIDDNYDRNYVYYRYNYERFRDEDSGSHLIFIEEPEAHLHPKVQVKVMEIFAEMVKSNIKVVMTTHSDYMKDKITNLLLSRTLEAKQVSSYHFVLGERGSYDAGDMKATAEGIEDHNFTQVAEDLYEERLSIYEEKNQADNVTEQN